MVRSKSIQMVIKQTGFESNWLQKINAALSFNRRKAV